MNPVTLATNLINVFPSARRSDIQPSARYQTESTFTEMIRRICNYKDPNEKYSCVGSFILTEPDTDAETGELYFDEDKPFEFYIYGYYFCIRQLKFLTRMTDFSPVSGEGPTDIYAYINLNEYKADSIDINTKSELVGRDETRIDDTTFYTGIQFTNKPTQVANRYYLHLFHREKGTEEWKFAFCKNSIYRISINALQKNIDCGEIK